MTVVSRTVQALPQKVLRMNAAESHRGNESVLS
jgi:hypothetical protein